MINLSTPPHLYPLRPALSCRDWPTSASIASVLGLPAPSSTFQRHVRIRAIFRHTPRTPSMAQQQQQQSSDRVDPPRMALPPPPTHAPPRDLGQFPPSLQGILQWSATCASHHAAVLMPHCRSLQFEDGLAPSPATPLDEGRRQFLLNAISSLTAEVTEKIRVRA